MVSNPMHEYIKSLHQQQKTKEGLLEAARRQQQQVNDDYQKKLQDILRGLNGNSKSFNQQFYEHIERTTGKTYPNQELPPKVKKIYDLWSGTTNDGEKSAAEQALKRMGYKIESGKAVKA